MWGDMCPSVKASLNTFIQPRPTDYFVIQFLHSFQKLRLRPVFCVGKIRSCSITFKTVILSVTKKTLFDIFYLQNDILTFLTFKNVYLIEKKTRRILS